MSTTTQISNGTKHTMKLQVGSARFASPLATVAPGGKYSIGVNFNATYREYIIQIDAPGRKKIIVSSDDLCDNKGITIKEEDGKLDMQMEARQADAATSTDPPSQTARKFKWVPAWMSSLIRAEPFYTVK